MDKNSRLFGPYLSLDVECDGPIPGYNSMLSLGAVAFRIDKPTGHLVVIDDRKFNFEPLPGGIRDPDTMRWWDRQQPSAWMAATENAKHPQTATNDFIQWVLAVQKDYENRIPTPVAYPATFDYMFIHWYVQRFYGTNPLGFSCLDIKTLAMATMRCGFKKAAKKNMPESWMSNLPPHTHDALDDAREQAQLFCNIMKDLLGLGKAGG